MDAGIDRDTWRYIEILDIDMDICITIHIDVYIFAYVERCGPV